MSQIARLIAACQPSKHFMGLWVVRQKRVRERRVLWVTTWWDRDGEYSESRFFRDPIRALRACAKDLGVREREP